MLIRHKKLSGAPAPSNSDQIGGPDWNADHVFSGPRLLGFAWYWPGRDNPTGGGTVSESSGNIFPDFSFTTPGLIPVEFYLPPLEQDDGAGGIERLPLYWYQVMVQSECHASVGGEPVMTRIRETGWTMDDTDPEEYMYQLMLAAEYWDGTAWAPLEAVDTLKLAVYINY